MNQLKAKVKWWNSAKGYGFLETETHKDIFVHYSSLQCEGFQDLKDNETVYIELIEGPKGPQAGKVFRNLLSPENKDL